MYPARAMICSAFFAPFFTCGDSGKKTAFGIVVLETI